VDLFEAGEEGPTPSEALKARVVSVDGVGGSCQLTCILLDRDVHCARDILQVGLEQVRAEVASLAVQKRRTGKFGR
jgi:hypothetical protein